MKRSTLVGAVVAAVAVIARLSPTIRLVKRALIV